MIASRAQVSDLYCSLSGGGGGNYGVVVSMTVRAHKDAMVSGAAVQFTAASISSKTFYKAVTLFPVTAYNQTTDDVKYILAPFLSALTSLSITYKATLTQFDSYYDHYTSTWVLSPGAT